MSQWGERAPEGSAGDGAPGGERADGGPRRLGQYRLEERLGEGGMGTVFRAYDERLRRPVAIKLIRRGSAADDVARQRFRREARAVAALNHPAVVQIHDLVESADTEALVMELVEGQPLGVELRGPRLPLARALRLAAEIAGGLAAAHARGIVHRDLKPANVMVTPDGHAKLLDFGLAKRLRGETGEVPLSGVGAVLGTYRAMSPEQIRNQPIDDRSDLFAFGTLLYELVTGRYPFAAGNALDLMSAICTLQPESPERWHESLPPGLAELILRLLEKDPHHRPASAEAVARELTALAEGLREEPATGGDERGAAALLDQPTLAEGALPAAPGGRSAPRPRRGWIRVSALAAAVAAAAALVLWGDAAFRRPPAPLYVAILTPPAAARADAEERWLAEGLELSLERGLLAFEGVFPLPPESPAPGGSPVEVARAVAADEVLRGDLACREGSCRVVLERLDGRRGALLWTQSFDVPSGDPALLAEAVTAHLGEAFRGRRPRPGAQRPETQPRWASPEDLAEYLRIFDASTTAGGSLPAADLLARLAALRERAPRFLEPYVLAAELHRYRFAESRDSADLERGFALLAQARRLAPADPRIARVELDLALKGERLGQAETALAELARLAPDDPQMLVQRARVEERRGQPRQALETMRRAVERLPSWRNLVRAGDLEYRVGSSAAARSYLEAALARAPGQYAAQSLLAQIELLTGSGERAITLYQELVRRSPQATELSNLGFAYLLAGRFADAEASFDRAAALEPANPFFALNLADARAAAGRGEAAQPVYERAQALAAADPAAANWQLASVRAQALARLGRRAEALAALPPVLAEAAANGQAAYEAALTFALLGDEAAALRHGERALALGVAPRLFDLPGLGALRALAERPAVPSPPR